MSSMQVTTRSFEKIPLTTSFVHDNPTQQHDIITVITISTSSSCYQWQRHGEFGGSNLPLDAGPPGNWVTGSAIWAGWARVTGRCSKTPIQVF